MLYNYQLMLKQKLFQQNEGDCGMKEDVSVSENKAGTFNVKSCNSFKSCSVPEQQR